jgi:type IV pilus assembly protein PilX
MSRPASQPPSRHVEQRGIVLFVAMIAIIALALAAIALDRAVLTDVTIGANAAARTHVTLLAADAVERAVAALFETGAITDRGADDPAHNYFASMQAGEDGRGVPRTLHAIAAYPVDAAVIDAADHHQLRYVIERLCRNAGAAAVENCTLSPLTLAAATGAPGAGEPPRTPGYRVTVRVDGPAGAAVFVQTLLGEAPTHRRLSWRVLDE